MADLLDMTLLLVQTYGSGFNNKISGVLEKMKLSLCCEPVTSSPARQVNKQQTALIHKVATVSAFKQLLVRTITGLSDEELQEFKTLLLSKSGGSLSQVLLRLIHKFDRAEIVDLMIDQLGQQSVEVTRQILIDLKRTDLLQRLPESSSECEDNLSVGKQAAASVKREDFSKILLETLVDFDLRDLDKFRWLLQFTCFRRSVPQIPKDQLEHANSPHRLIHLMVERLGQRSLEVAREVLTDMNRRDLLKKLPETSTESKDFSLLLKSEANMKPDVKKLLEALQHLSHMELDHFKEILQNKVWSCSFRLVLRHQDEMVERLKVAEVMVQLLEKQSLQLAMDILEEIKRTDLQKMLFSSCSASETTPSAHPESGGHIQKDSSEWTRLEPKITDENEAPTYSLESAAGQFECSVSGLRWVCKDKLGFKYQFCSWQGHMERMKTRGLRCAGPLIDITVTTGKINEVYLPHWICIDDFPSLLENFSVLHINDSGDVLEKVFQVTATHVRLTEPVFSPLAALINSIFRVKVACNLLIYYKPHTPFLKLHVYLILQDPALQQSVHKEESSSGYEVIKKPRPDKYLRMQQGFTLSAAIDTARVQPQTLTLRYDNQDPNFYEVFIENPNRNFDLTLLCADSKKEDKKPYPVWTCEIRRDDHPKSGPVEGSSGRATCLSSPDEEHFVDKHREELVQRVKNIGPILDGLLQKKVLQEEMYNTIRSLQTSESQVREIFSCLRAGDACKNIFFSILQNKERNLIADLQKQKKMLREESEPKHTKGFFIPNSLCFLCSSAEKETPCSPENCRTFWFL
ncbi:NACHT, LRR and PYD domains-containing protein 1 homolog isoform X2 [Girardinichthys multiradiatus]|uniref:NACHT, LRR and PYD domains-containing protein 1 homolog isoform X2 n=1 Tax=Girardinichthys multiradiatus TaxID=208333 RepID=UPI001FACA0E5|nr:NACHT, LRR and PYD domains-containing protein 1 homolog isoform X2 [Girardinichthys multiradiatus]